MGGRGHTTPDKPVEACAAAPPTPRPQVTTGESETENGLAGSRSWPASPAPWPGSSPESSGVFHRSTNFQPKFISCFLSLLFLFQRVKIRVQSSTPSRVISMFVYITNFLPVCYKNAQNTQPPTVSSGAHTSFRMHHGCQTHLRRAGSLGAAEGKVRTVQVQLLPNG